MRGRDGDPWLLAPAGLDALIALIVVIGGSMAIAAVASWLGIRHG